MRTSGRSTARSLAAATAAAVLIAGAPSAAQAHDRGGPVLTPRTQFTLQPDGSSGATRGGDRIPNIDSVKATIRTYYNATDGVANKTTSPYITEMGARTSSALAQLPAVDPAAKKAVVLDADDTLLWTYDMEDAAMHFNFDPTLQNQWVQEQRFPATPSMVDFVNAVRAKGYAVFGITGRNAGQEAATLGNLTKDGYTGFDADNFYTKWVAPTPQPSYVTCAAASCTTVEYKAGTRKHIEQDLGYDIALNVGDQWSDLQGGFADATLKLPNPTYFLPSPDLDGTPADAAFSPRTQFTMQPDGSSGGTEGGEGIPNIDIVKTTIRTYYNATSGIANKSTSPYISQLDRQTGIWARQVRRACATYTRPHVKHRHHHHAQHRRAAIVLDADDTTLWTYDMEDAAMHFNFDPTLQDQWVQERRFPATPRMKRVVRAAERGGCKIFGVTGRNDNQRWSTIVNLNKVYGAGTFRPRHYFTKWTGVGKSQQPSYITCAAAKCTTVEYKSQTRRHIQRDLGYRVLANFGDQFSDLAGGYARRWYKLPNPTYYLP
jgi:predicted secreted acid phosphatase